MFRKDKSSKDKDSTLGDFLDTSKTFVKKFAKNLLNHEDGNQSDNDNPWNQDCYNYSITNQSEDSPVQVDSSASCVRSSNNIDI